MIRFVPMVALLCMAGATTVWADTYPKNPKIDALNYAFQIKLSDSTDAIDVVLTMDVRFVGPGVTSLRLDLIDTKQPGGKGMTVSAVTLKGQPVAYTHADNELIISLGTPPAVNERRQYVICYRGVPASGLKIAPNKYGDPTFFSDNWPDKARHWLAVIDHPSDKATCEFMVTAPSHYQVVSNGLKIEESDLGAGKRLTHWRQGVPIAPWLYVLGAARFAVQYVDRFDNKSIETWVYAQDRDAGFSDFAEPTKKVLAFYSDYVGPFAYERLANIQSNSVSGGMEAASAILYSEKSVTGNKSLRWRNVVIHEIAHQWFGNAVTEADWDDVWLSEGFATYFTLLFIEHAYGHDEFMQGLRDSRKTVLNFYAKNPGYTIVHRNLSNMEDVTSSHTYQKGSWILHMLRGVLGDDAFQSGIRKYYAAYFNGNATTGDFRQVMEEVSGRELGWFFDQWLYKPGNLRLSGSWTFDSKAKMVRLTLKQIQGDGSRFRMPMEVGLLFKGQELPVIERIELNGDSSEFAFPAIEAPVEVRLDPNGWVLMEGEVSRKK
ncbi:MAG: M1 family peptidase [Cyclobacteriaceae bacterium]|nr:M1 family peptidase [Cyclobacteriaceae bacterium]